MKNAFLIIQAGKPARKESLGQIAIFANEFIREIPLHPKVCIVFNKVVDNSTCLRNQQKPASAY